MSRCFGDVDVEIEKGTSKRAQKWLYYPVIDRASRNGDKKNGQFPGLEIAHLLGSGIGVNPLLVAMN
jgi:hypothetical protein